jgi:hypothetical protein
MVHVVLDANAVLLDWRPGESWRKLERAAEDGAARLCLPAVVVDEVLAHKRNRFKPEVARAIEAVRALAAGEPRAGYAILPYPAVDHRTVVARALARRRPFDAKGRNGYRDALIWETVLELARGLSEGRVLLCTRNSKDFGERGLHADLRAEVASLAVPVELLTQVSAFASWPSAGPPRV